MYGYDYGYFGRGRMREHPEGRVLRRFHSHQRPGPNRYRAATDYGALYGSNFRGGRAGINFYGGRYGAEYYGGRRGAPRAAYDREYGRSIGGPYGGAGPRDRGGYDRGGWW